MELAISCKVALGCESQALKSTRNKGTEFSKTSPDYSLLPTEETDLKNDGFFVKILDKFKLRYEKEREKVNSFLQKDAKERTKTALNFLLDHAMIIALILAVIVIAIIRPRFISTASIVNILSLTAARLPIALGIGGAIVLSGTDISAGRAVGLTACITASLLQMTGYAGKMFSTLPSLPIPLVLFAALAVGAAVGLINGFFVAKFKLHPFIVTLSTQLIIYGAILLYLQIGGNGGQTLSGLDPAYIDFVAGPLFKIGTITVPRYILYSLIVTVIIWVIWNSSY